MARLESPAADLHILLHIMRVVAIVRMAVRVPMSMGVVVTVRVAVSGVIALI